MATTDKASLIIKRASGWRDLLRNYQVHVDGQRVGQLRHGGTFSYEVAPGRHSIYLKIDWCVTSTLEIACQAGEQIGLRCYSQRQGAWHSLPSSDPGAYIELSLAHD